MASVLWRHSPLPRFAKGDRVRLNEEGRRARWRVPPTRIGTIVKRAPDGRYLYVLWEGVHGPVDLAGAPVVRERILEDYLQAASVSTSGADPEATIRPRRRRKRG
jgi:hypothetical protein